GSSEPPLGASARHDYMKRFINRQLAERGPFLCGSKLYVCDYFLAMLVRWTRLMASPAHTHPNLNKLVRAVMERPGYARMLKAEGIQQPV
ncbi:MAG TPA: glutathione S-transferase family protein, partial [Dongiaceae bacterium]